jgi:hypothetical protein
MAGDWIKMRPGLLTSPKVNGIARLLENSTPASEALSTGHNGPLREIVTRNVLRYVTVTALLLVWGAANEHTRNGTFHNADLSDIDDIAGVPGFAQAMMAVGWLEYDAELEAVTLPNFNEYNTSGLIRSAGAKSNAERQREYRERKKRKEIRNENVVTHNVTLHNDSNRREEKSREEKNIKEKTNKKENAGNGEPAGTDGVCSPPGVVPIETEKPPPPGRPTDIPSAPPPTSPYGAICAYVRSQRMLASPSDQAFRDLVDSGASMQHFVDAVAVAQSKGKGWGYLLGIVRNQLEHERAAVAKAKPSAGPPAAPIRLFRKGWDSSPFGVHEVGAELGIPKREDEDEIQYRDRIRLAVKECENQGQQRSVA